MKERLAKHLEDYDAVVPWITCSSPEENSYHGLIVNTRRRIVKDVGLCFDRKTSVDCDHTAQRHMKYTRGLSDYNGLKLIKEILELDSTTYSVRLLMLFGVSGERKSFYRILSQQRCDQ